MKNVGEYLVDADVDNIIGEGTYGKVFAGHHVRTEKPIAAKMFMPEKDCISEEIDREAHTMMNIPDHENVLKILDYIKKEIVKKKTFVQIWLILEFCPLGTLGEFVKANSLSTIKKVGIIVQSAYGVHHLHHLEPKGITHRDIKLSNILVSGSKESPVIKIADFGEAKFIDRINDRSLSAHSVKGTKPYMAPELFEKNPSYGKKVDIFSLGVSSLAVLDAQEGSSVSVITGE